MNIINSFFRAGYEKLIIEYLQSPPAKKSRIKKELNDKYNIFYLKEVKTVDRSFQLMIRNSYQSIFYEYTNGKLIFKGERNNVNIKKASRTI